MAFLQVGVFSFTTAATSDAWGFCKEEYVKQNYRIEFCMTKILILKQRFLFSYKDYFSLCFGGEKLVVVNLLTVQ